MSGDLAIGPVPAEGFPKVLAFFRRWLPDGERVAALFEWRESNRPASGGNRPWGAWLGDELVGIMNGVPTLLQGRGRQVEALWHADTIVAPALRGRGIASQLLRRTAERNALVMAKGSNEKMYSARKRVGFFDVPASDYLIRPLAIEWSGQWRRLGMSIGVNAFSWVGRRRSAPQGLQINLVEAFSQWYDGVANPIDALGSVGPAKSLQYLEWRYRQVPGRRYRILEAQDKAGPRGAAIIRDPHEEGGDAWLVDIIAPPDDRDAHHALVHGAIRHASVERASALRTFASSRFQRGILRRAGFVSRRFGPQFTYYDTSTPADLIPSAIEWNFWHGDGDNELY